MSNDKFDLKVHHIDPKSGKLVKSNPYRLHVSKSKGRLFERPPGSGIMYYKNGKIAHMPKEQEEKKEEPKQELKKDLSSKPLKEKSKDYLEKKSYSEMSKSSQKSY